MQNTINYNLKKPDYTDFADIADINDNMDTIDAQLAAPTGDSADSTTTFTTSDTADGSASSWTTVPALASGETHKSLFAKMSQMFKNVRYLYKLLGTTDISSIGDGTVTKALSVLNANFKTAITSDSDLDSLLGNCFFGGIGYPSLYFDIADFNGIQIDNGSQRTQIVVALNDLLYRTDDVEDGHTGSWSEWHTLPYNTTTLLSTLSSEKLDKSQVANNVATTKSGYALDARQGKELNDAIANKQKTLKLAQWNGNITTYANNGRTVTISPATLGISGTVTVYSVNVYANAETYNNIFISHSGYTAGTGVKIYAYNATSTGKEFPVTVNVLYS